MQALLARTLPQLERQARVGDDVGRRRVDEILLCEPVADAVLRGRAVAGDELGARDATWRVLRMELEGEPGDLSAELALEPQRARFRDAAEGSDEIRPDRDLGA